jgi:hypothetical protein
LEYTKELNGTISIKMEEINMKKEVAATKENKTIVTEVPKKATKKKSYEKITVKLKAFTGMEIGTFEANLKDGLWEVETKKGTLKFDKEGHQIDAKNPRFANHITF